MNITKVTCAYFSPGGTTKKVVQGIGSCFSDCPKQDVNLTDYDVRQNTFAFEETDLLIIGAPAYGGRLPTPVGECLSRFRGSRTPVVLVATYGNRSAGDTLMELKKELSIKGFIPVAAATFIGQHTFMSEVALGRPDEKDMAVVKEFGEKIKDRLPSAVIYHMGQLDIPGTYPYAREPMTKFPFQVETNEYCIMCMLCAASCPVKAINDQNPRDINNDCCVRCGTCIRLCPAQAKSFTKKPFEALQDDLLRPLIDVREEPWYQVG